MRNLNQSLVLLINGHQSSIELMWVQPGGSNLVRKICSGQSVYGYTFMMFAFFFLSILLFDTIFNALFKFFTNTMCPDAQGIEWDSKPTGQSGSIFDPLTLFALMILNE